MKAEHKRKIQQQKASTIKVDKRNPTMKAAKRKIGNEGHAKKRIEL